MKTVENDRGILIVISGFSGAGKGTVMKALLAKYDRFALSVSVTTRAPREGEEEGVSYFFRTREAFERLIRENALIEYAEYVGNYYGTPRAYVEKCLEDGRDVILEIEMQGTRKVKEMYPDAVTVFITPPTYEELKERLLSRGTESEEVIIGRLRRAVEEAEVIREYDYLAINETDKVDQCVEDIYQIICSEHAKASRNRKFIEDFRKSMPE